MARREDQLAGGALGWSAKPNVMLLIIVRCVSARCIQVRAESVDLIVRFGVLIVFGLFTTASLMIPLSCVSLFMITCIVFDHVVCVLGWRVIRFWRIVRALLWRSKWIWFH